jgi:hypothetical protein
MAMEAAAGAALAVIAGLLLTLQGPAPPSARLPRGDPERYGFAMPR